MQFYTTRFKVGATLAVIVIVLAILAGTASGQDMQGTRTMQTTINFVFSPTADGDTLDLLEIPAGSVIKQVYVLTDTTTTSVDSLQLRLGASVIRVYGWTPAVDGGTGAISTSTVNIPVESDDILRLQQYASVDAAGQVRITIEWIPIF